jgi:hypothetical protein
MSGPPLWRSSAARRRRPPAGVSDPESGLARIRSVPDRAAVRTGSVAKVPSFPAACWLACVAASAR